MAAHLADEVIFGDVDSLGEIAVSHGLEIVPTNAISLLETNSTVALTSVYNGKRVRSRLTILPAQGRSMTLSTTTNRAALLRITKPGKYLVTTTHKGKSCSLTFAIRKKKPRK